MSEAISGVCLFRRNPACRFAHAGYKRDAVVAGHCGSKNGVVSLAYVPAIHVFSAADK